MDYQDQLPCGGYEKQDQDIQQNLQALSLQADGNAPIKKQIKKCNGCEQGNCENCKCKQAAIKKQQAKQKTNPPKKKAECKKCKINQAVLVHKNQIICYECLMKNIEYKTRLTLQNKVKVKSKSRILLCFSGGLNSVCLVNVMKNIKKRYQKNPLFGDLQCVHIQQQSKLPDGYVPRFQEITGLKLHIIPIQKVYEGQEMQFQQIRSLFKKLAPASNSLDLLQIMRNKLILDYARDANFDFVMAGKNGESLAAEIFKYFTKGIGGSTGQLCSNQQGPYSYPLRQHLQKELQYYFYAEKLGNLTMLADQDDLSYIASSQIDNLLNNFITNLQDRYSHTSPAIVRTGQKLQRKDQTTKKPCKWCYLSHNQTNPICQKCFRLNQYFNNEKVKQMLPNWMKI